MDLLIRCLSKPPACVSRTVHSRKYAMHLSVTCNIALLTTEKVACTELAEYDNGEMVDGVGLDLCMLLPSAGCACLLNLV